MILDLKEGALQSISNCQAGTPLFMAREVLLGRPYKHNLRHDLESLMYVLIWYILGYRPTELPLTDPLRKWRKGDYKDMLLEKQLLLCTQCLSVNDVYMALDMIETPVVYQALSLIDSYHDMVQAHRISKATQKILSRRLRYEKATKYAQEQKEMNMKKSLFGEDIQIKYEEDFESEFSRLRSAERTERASKPSNFTMLSYCAWKDAISLSNGSGPSGCLNDCCNYM